MSEVGVRTIHAMWLPLGLLVVAFTAIACRPSAPSDRVRAEEALQRALGLEEAGYPRDAEDAYREAIRLDPSFVWPYYRLGVLSSNLGRTGAAEAHYRRAIRVDPNFMPPYYDLALLQAAASDYQEAERLLSRVLELAPRDVNARVVLARAYRVLRREAEAAGQLAVATELDPNAGELLTRPLPGFP